MRVRRRDMDPLPARRPPTPNPGVWAGGESRIQRGMLPVLAELYAQADLEAEAHSGERAGLTSGRVSQVLWFLHMQDDTEHYLRMLQMDRYR